MEGRLLRITAEMTLLDMLSDYPATEAVLKAYDQTLGTCLCCTMLFESVTEVAARHQLDLTALLHELNQVIPEEARDTTGAPRRGSANDPLP